MYSPKIKEEFIPKLYSLAKEKGVPMTELVNQFIQEKLEEYQPEANKLTNNS